MILRNAPLGVTGHPFYPPWTTWRYSETQTAMGKRPSPVKVHGESGHIAVLTTTSNARCTEPSTALPREIIHVV